MRLMERPTSRCGRYRLIGDGNCRRLGVSYEFKSCPIRKRISTISASLGYLDISLSSGGSVKLSSDSSWCLSISILYDESVMSFRRKNEGQGFRPAKRIKIRYPDFQAIARINRKVVTLTSDEHAYTKDDEHKIRRLLSKVRKTANDEEPFESIIQKTSLLMFQIAGGQHFYEGNKRTALAVAEAFLKFNGYTMNMEDSGLLDVVYKAGIGQAGLSNVRDIIRQLIRSV